jgi:DNA polymerase-3 subunit gamma/tau
MVLLRMLAFRPADTAEAPRQPLKPVGISQATVDSAKPVAATPVVASVAAAPVTAQAPAPAPAAPVVVPEPEPEPMPEPVVEAVVVEAVVDLPWNDPVEPEVVQQPAVEPVLETASEQPELPPMPLPTPDSVVPDAPEWAAAPIPEPTVAEVDAGTPGMDLDDEPPLDEDYIEPDIDSAYSYLDELASEHAAEPAAEPEPEPAAAPATGLALQWLELFPNLPISGMTGSIAANCTLIAVEGDNWLLHLDPAHSALFNATQQRRLNEALNQYHGRTLTLTMELIKPEQETPAQAASRRRADRQREAEESIHGDPFIQQMMQQFGAVIRNDTIEPVEALVSQG